MSQLLSIVIGLHRVVNALDAETRKICQEYQLTLSQFSVLEALYHKGELTVSEVRDKVLSSSGTIPVLVKNLEKKGCLVRLTDLKDRRRTLLRLTDQGRTLIEEVYPLNEERMRELMDLWTEEERAFLKEYLMKWSEAYAKKSY